MGSLDSMAIIIIFIIVGAWAAFLLPSMFTSKSDRPLESAREFNRLSATLNAVGGATTIAPLLTRRRVLARRRRALTILISLAVATLAVAIWQSMFSLLVAHIVIDAVIAWYVAMLVQIRQRREGHFVVDLTDDAMTGESQPEIRIVANG